ncbi:Low-density lipoprotein receptor domain class A [Ancylostoma caninum]|uniref:Low-density lipoprotein receptor domain class A n=1 Tax=Ancylostoma caninum TaxID=29170 RepID=A0A368G0U8_ANCCA|nr:Low-density lipoprotein receptor domain class A [Ancylostoma caninum]
MARDYNHMAPATCNSTSFHCSLSEQCVPLSQRCDGHYDCSLEEDEQNCRVFYVWFIHRKFICPARAAHLCGSRADHCALCTADEFACIVSEQCIDANRRCNGIAECSDGTDEMDCDGESAHQRAHVQ